MLSNEELTAIKALDLTPEVEEEIISQEEKHREVLFTKSARSNEHPDQLTTNTADSGDEIDEEINLVPGCERLFTRKDDLIPWNVQFS